jgi:hypothetical protein
MEGGQVVEEGKRAAVIAKQRPSDGYAAEHVDDEAERELAV